MNILTSEQSITELLANECLDPGNPSLFRPYCLCTCTCVYKCVYVCVRMCTCVHARAYVCVRVCTHVHVCAYVKTLATQFLS